MIDRPFIASWTIICNLSCSVGQNKYRWYEEFRAKDACDQNDKVLGKQQSKTSASTVMCERYLVEEDVKDKHGFIIIFFFKSFYKKRVKTAAKKGCRSTRGQGIQGGPSLFIYSVHMDKSERTLLAEGDRVCRESVQWHRITMNN